MPFDDLASVEWAHTAISTLSDRGIVSGKSNNKYCPNDYITREELVKIIVSATKTELNASGSNFADVTEDAWFAKYVNAAYSNGLCKGIGNGNFGVGINITRQDAATMLYNALVNENAELAKQLDKSFVDSSEISNYAIEAVQKLSEAGIVNGDSNQNFNPKSLLTRAEAAQLVYGCLKYFE